MVDFGITRGGVSFMDLSVAFEHIGIRTKSLKLSYEKLQQLPMPCVVHWKNCHFVVVFKASKSKVWISDY